MLGKTIFHYKILEKLGEGGMGVVYKAEDTRLKRTVALKFLPSSIMVSEAEKTRFVHEAQAAAALNHPNICTIHEIDEADGQQFIAMEFVEGASLKEKIEAGPLKLDEALNIAMQVAEGLQAAHEKKITHRDIKPANVMMTNKGQAKIMDFGLAKLAGRTVVTKEGMTLGTVAYMSPEQGRGEEVDHRTDIWAFGVVLYEMITGQLPFRGEYEAAMMYSLMNENPEPLTGLRTGVPMELERLVNKCLEKQAAHRYQHADDLLADLRRLKNETGRVSRQLSGEKKISDSRAAVAAPRSSQKKRWLSLGALAVLAIVVSVLLLLPQRSPELNPNMTFRVLQTPFTEVSYPGWSADGNWLAFPAVDANGKWDVYFMNTSGGEPRRITADSSDYILSVDVSPDGARVVYDRLSFRLRKTDVCIVPSLGGPSKVVVSLGGGVSWRPDGERIGYIQGHPFTSTSKSGRLELWSIKPDGSDNRLEFMDSTIAEMNTRAGYSWSSDGKSIAWIRTFPEGYTEVILRELETGKERQLTFDQKMIDEVCWTPNNQIIFSSTKSGNSNLWITPANGGQALQITKGSGPDIAMNISTDGKKLMYMQRQEIGRLWLARIDGSSARQITFDERNILNPVFSPDGRRLLFCMGDSDILKPAIHLYAMNRDGGNRQQITSGDQITRFPSWSPDGRWIAYSARSISEPLDSAKVYLMEASSLANPRLLGRGSGRCCWIDPRSFIVFTSSNSCLFSVDGTAPKRVSEDSTFAIPVFGEKDALLLDLRKGREGWWMAPMADAPAPRPPTKILEFRSRLRFALAPSREFLYYVINVGELRKITLPDGKDQRLPGTFPFLKSDFSVSYDGQEIVWVDHRQQGKLVMIENLFK